MYGSSLGGGKSKTNNKQDFLQGRKDGEKKREDLDTSIELKRIDRMSCYPTVPIGFVGRKTKKKK